MTPALDSEWLESDALGGFASGTVAGYRTRRYHALLLSARRPPSDRYVLVNGLDVFLTGAGATWPLSTQHYGPDVLYPRGLDLIVGFAAEPWPRWSFRMPDGSTIAQECVVDRASGYVVVAWQLVSAADAAPRALTVRPLLSGRDYHALMRESPAFDFSAREAGGNVTWRPYAGLPAIAALSNGRYEHQPEWYRNFLYREEALRGLDCSEDLASPGMLHFDLRAGEAVVVLRADDAIGEEALALATGIRARERAHRAPLAPLERAAESYIVHRGAGHTIIAGYPWFTDWGRDTFIAMRGLVLTLGRYDIAASVLLAWSECVSEGMLPNRFPDQGQAPEYNAVDASLWYVIVVGELLAAAPPDATVSARLRGAAAAIVDGYSAGTRYGIRMDDDGLLACGVPGMQLTWMDARVGGREVTPRIGKPVEVQALWINALATLGGAHARTAARAQAAFESRFFDATCGCLYDVVDADHVRGRVDASLRPNQIFAVGGLPRAIIHGDVARAVVATVERELVTPLGLRSLAPSDPAYRGRCAGAVAERDDAYHQGTAWPWLMGAFVDAWLKVHGDDAAHRAIARNRFVAPLEAQLGVAGLGHVSEFADGDVPHTPRGCPFQAWSTGELIRARARTASAATST